MRIAGEAGVPYKFAQCCRPVPGDQIVAYITRGNAVSIHHRSCKVLMQAEQRRIMEASWGTENNQNRFPVKVSLKAKDRVGLIRDITEVIARNNVNILYFGREKMSGSGIKREVILEVSDDAQFKQVMESLERVRDVLEVEKDD